ncbi:hypothetical protein EDB85DRAFT_1900311 [Lactarius pseudohatsudake]|nr:hypothetical protein EDB85DRAFT_1900311 [Lactarius pseudohatsudake]
MPLSFFKPWLHDDCPVVFNHTTCGSNPGTNPDSFPAFTGWDPVIPARLITSSLTTTTLSSIGQGSWVCGPAKQQQRGARWEVFGWTHGAYENLSTAAAADLAGSRPAARSELAQEHGALENAQPSWRAFVFCRAGIDPCLCMRKYVRFLHPFLCVDLREVRTHCRHTFQSSLRATANVGDPKTRTWRGCIWSLFRDHFDDPASTDPGLLGSRVVDIGFTHAEAEVLTAHFTQDIEAHHHLGKMESKSVLSLSANGARVTGSDCGGALGFPLPCAGLRYV